MKHEGLRERGRMTEFYIKWLPSEKRMGERVGLTDPVQFTAQSLQSPLLFHWTCGESRADDSSSDTDGHQAKRCPTEEGELVGLNVKIIANPRWTCGSSKERT